MNCVEILARVDTLCVDKTGTITEPEWMDKLVLLDEENFPEDAVMEMLAAFYDNMDATVHTGAALAACLRMIPTGGPGNFIPLLPKQMERHHLLQNTAVYRRAGIHYGFACS